MYEKSCASSNHIKSWKDIDFGTAEYEVKKLQMRIAKAVKYRTIPLFITFMVMSSILAMFIDSITVILFLAAATVFPGGHIRPLQPFRQGRCVIFSAPPRSPADPL